MINWICFHNHNNDEHGKLLMMSGLQQVSKDTQDYSYIGMLVSIMENGTHGID